MFKIESVNVGAKPNPSNVFNISCSRDALEILIAGINYYTTTCTSLDLDYIRKQGELLEELNRANHVTNA